MFEKAPVQNYTLVYYELILAKKKNKISSGVNFTIVN